MDASERDSSPTSKRSSPGQIRTPPPRVVHQSPHKNALNAQIPAEQVRDAPASFPDRKRLSPLSVSPESSHPSSHRRCLRDSISLPSRTSPRSPKRIGQFMAPSLSSSSLRVRKSLREKSARSELPGESVAPEIRIGPLGRLHMTVTPPRVSSSLRRRRNRGIRPRSAGHSVASRLASRTRSRRSCATRGPVVSELKEVSESAIAQTSADAATGDLSRDRGENLLPPRKMRLRTPVSPRKTTHRFAKNPLVQKFSQFENLLLRTLVDHLQVARIDSPRSSSDLFSLDHLVLSPVQCLWLAEAACTVLHSIESVLRGFFDSFAPRVRELCPRGAGDPAFKSFLEIALKMNRLRIADVVLKLSFARRIVAASFEDRGVSESLSCDDLSSDPKLKRLLGDSVFDLGSLFYILAVTYRGSNPKFEVRLSPKDFLSLRGKRFDEEAHTGVKFLKNPEHDLADSRHQKVFLVVCPSLVIITPTPGELSRPVFLLRKASVVVSSRLLSIPLSPIRGTGDFEWKMDVISSPSSSNLAEKETELLIRETQLRAVADSLKIGFYEKKQEFLESVSLREAELKVRVEAMAARERDFESLAERVQALKKAESMVALQRAKMKVRLEALETRESEPSQHDPSFERWSGFRSGEFDSECQDACVKSE